MTDMVMARVCGELTGALAAREHQLATAEDETASLRAILSEREKELAEWRDIKEQMRCLTIYSKRDLQVKVAMQIRLREAAEREMASLREALKLAVSAYENPDIWLADARAALSPSQESSEETP